jgi:acetyl esterase/lipase
MRVFEDLRYGPHPEQKLDIYLPEGQCNVFMVWFHGGSLKFGSRKDIRFHEDLMEHGIGVASVEYRMYPNVNFPVFKRSFHFTLFLCRHTACQIPHAVIGEIFL